MNSTETNMMEWYSADSTGECIRYNVAKVPFDDLTCLYPMLKPFTLSFERSYDPVLVRDWMEDHPVVPIIAVVCYGLFIFFGRRYFKTNEPWNWRTSMCLWNLSLSIFSAIGFCRVLPAVYKMLVNYTAIDNMCLDPEAHYGSDGPAGLWIQMFVLSKFPELFDTFFIVIHKKPLLFLHWYHHVSVLLYCWHTYVMKSTMGVYFCVMNYFVHSVMYFYYFLMAVKCKPKWLKAHWITGIQIVQMFVGVSLTIAGWYLRLMGMHERGCYVSWENTLMATVMYGSYLFLFLQFFFTRFGSTKKKSTKTSDAKATAATNGHSKRD